MAENPISESTQDKTGNRFEIVCAITLAIFAAILAITDLGGSKYGDDEIMGTNEKANIYAWYQSKGIKQSLVEGERDLINTLVEAGAIKAEQVPALQGIAAKLEDDINRYKKEKRELLLGSSAVGKDNWIQEVDGELGKVIGANQWEKKLESLGRAGDNFDLSVLFLQLSLVIGAVSLVLQERRLKWTFYVMMVLLGAAGIIYAVMAFAVALPVG